MPALNPGTRFRRLPDDSWGVQVDSPEDLTGETVEVRRRDESVSTVRLTALVYRLDDPSQAVYRMEDLSRPSSEEDELAVPQLANDLGRQMLAGDFSCYVTVPGGQCHHVTVTARRRGSGGGWVRCSMLAANARISIRVAGYEGRVARVVPGFQVQWFDGTDEVKDAVRSLFAAAGHRANRATMEERGYYFVVDVLAAPNPRRARVSATVLADTATPTDAPTLERPSLTQLARLIEDEADRVIDPEALAKAVREAAV